MFSLLRFLVWKLLFVLVRLGSITLGVLTFWYGLQQVENKDTSYADGDFNTQIVRWVSYFLTVFNWWD